MGTNGGTPVAEHYTDHDDKFIGRIHSVSIDLKDTKAAVAEEIPHARRDAPLRKMLSD